MAIFTPRFNLRKPDRTEYFSIVRDFNDNWDKLDLLVAKETDLQAVESRVDVIESDVVIIESNIDSLELRTTTAESDIDNLELSKVDKIIGKELSENDYTDADKLLLTETIPAQLAETENRINNIIVTPAVGVSEQEILDARDGEATLGAKVKKISKGVTVVTVSDGEDVTAKLQAALDGKGHIKVFGAGTVLTGKLTIYSDTWLDINYGLTIKKKDGTNNHLLVSSYYEDAVRNKNIRISGGKWDMNDAGNPNSGGSYQAVPRTWSGIGILMHGVDGLKIEKVQEIGGEHKYAYLIADCTNIYCGYINFANESDGLHFQPPIKNLLVENLTGWTHDDMVSFTMGDYTRFALGVDGDIENVLVRNIYAADTTDEHIKLVGDGINRTSVFRNMRFENIRGEATIASVCIPEKDIVDGNAYLNGTHLENIVFSNIQSKVAGGVPVFLLSATSGDITIENAVWDQTGTSRYIRMAGGSGGTIDKLTVRNIKSLTPVAYAMSSFIYADSTVTLKQLVIEDCRLNFNLATTGYFVYLTNGNIKQIMISNSWFETADADIRFVYMEGASADRVNLQILNSYIKTQILILASSPITAQISSSKITTSLNIAYLTDGADVKIMSTSCVYAVAVQPNTPTAVRKFGISGYDIGFAGLLSTLTAIAGDMVRSTNASEPTGKGLYFYNGTAWEKISA